MRNEKEALLLRFHKMALPVAMLAIAAVSQTVQAQSTGTDAIEEVVVRKLRVVILKGHQTQCRRLLHASELCEHDGLDYGESLSRPRVQIVGALGPSCGLDELPGCISKPEERRSIVSRQVVTLRVHDDSRQGLV